jgi:hypothetical protein
LLVRAGALLGLRRLKYITPQSRALWFSVNNE